MSTVAIFTVTGSPSPTFELLGYGLDPYGLYPYGDPTEYQPITEITFTVSTQES